jgi:hypothetical protein
MKLTAQFREADGDWREFGHVDLRKLTMEKDLDEVLNEDGWVVKREPRRITMDLTTDGEAEVARGAFVAGSPVTIRLVNEETGELVAEQGFDSIAVLETGQIGSQPFARLFMVLDIKRT